MTPETPTPEEMESLWRGRIDPSAIRGRAGAGGGEAWDAAGEAALAAAWNGLPKPPAPAGNFASRVLAAIDAEERRTGRRNAAFGSVWRRWLRPLAAAAAVLVAGWGGWSGFESRARLNLARSARDVSEAVGGSSGVEVLRDFETIRALEDGERAAGDVALMQAVAE